MISQPPSFVPGPELAERLDAGAVRPLLERFAPELPYAAGLIGSGSDVLGLDTVRPMDHDWGPRLFLYLGDGRLPELRDRLDQMLRERLPPAIAEHPTGFRQFVDDEGTRHMDQAMASGPIDHAIAITSVSAFLHWFGVSRTDELSATT